MKSFMIAAKDFKIRFADRKGFLVMIAMPIILTAILGAALGGVMSGEMTLPTTKVGILLPDEDRLAQDFTEGVLESEDMKNLISTEKMKSVDELKDKINQGDLQVGIVFPEDWSSNLNEGKLKPVQFYQDPTKELQGSIVETILTSFQQRVLAVATTSTTVLTDLSTSQPVMTGELKMEELAGSIIGELQTIASSDSSLVKIESKGEKSVSGMQYYAAAMGAMFLLFNAMVGGKSIASERADETLKRLSSTPTSNFSIITGKFLGTLYYSIVQFTLFVLFTSLAFDVNWGSNLTQVMTIGFVYSFAVSGLSMLMAALFADVKTIDMVGSIGVQIMALLGGSMVPLAIFPEALQKLANIAPNKWALSSFLDIMNGTTWGALTSAIIVLVAIGTTSLMIGTMRLKVQ